MEFRAEKRYKLRYGRMNGYYHLISRLFREAEKKFNRMFFRISILFLMLGNLMTVHLKQTELVKLVWWTISEC
jgi:hypothetical protein